MRSGWAGLLVLVAIACTPPQQPAPSVPTLAPMVLAVQQLPGNGFAFRGSGSAQTEEVVATIGIDLVTLSHAGQSTFIVAANQDGHSELVTQAIGRYEGQRPLVVAGALTFSVTADGEWTITIQPLASGGMPAFTGSGDRVSAYFTPPADGTAWSMSHDGSSFFVYAHCLGGSTVVADRAGPFRDTAQISFKRGPCFWEVHADGAWRLQPEN